MKKVNIRGVYEGFGYTTIYSELKHGLDMLDDYGSLIFSHNPPSFDTNDRFVKPGFIEPDIYVVVGLPVFATDKNIRYVGSHSKLKVCLSMIETEQLPESWSIASRFFDYILCPSTHSCKVFAASGVKTILFPLPVNDAYFCPKKRTLSHDKPFRFFAHGTLLFDYNRCRKNTMLLIDTFIKHYGNNKDVELVIHTVNNEEYKGPLPDNITITTGYLRTQELVDLYHTASCLIYPTKGEGFGLPPLEAAATGCPVAITNYSAQCDYMKELEMIPIEPSSITTPITYPPYNEAAYGATLTEDNIVEAMEYTIKNYDIVADKAFVNAYKVQDKYNVITVAKHFVEILDSLEL